MSKKRKHDEMTEELEEFTLQYDLMTLEQLKGIARSRNKKRRNASSAVQKTLPDRIVLGQLKADLIQSLKDYEAVHRKSKEEGLSPPKKRRKRKKKSPFKPPKVQAKKALFESKSKSKSKHQVDAEDMINNSIRLRSNKSNFDQLFSGNDSDETSTNTNSNTNTNENKPSDLQILFRRFTKNATKYGMKITINEATFIQTLKKNGITNIAALDLVLGDITFGSDLTRQLGLNVVQSSLLKVLFKSENNETSKNTISNANGSENIVYNKCLPDFKQSAINTNQKSLSPEKSTPPPPIRVVFDCVPDGWDGLNTFKLISDDVTLLKDAGCLTLGFNSMLLICVETVLLVHMELEIKKSQIGWNSQRGGNYIYCNVLKKGSDGTFKKRKIVSELCAWDHDKALEIEMKYKESKKTFMCPDMKNEMKQEINKFNQQFELDNTKLPVNPDFYLLFQECYSTRTRDTIADTIQMDRMDD
eukprot:214208_1